MKNLNRFLYGLALIKFVLPYFLQDAIYEPAFSDNASFLYWISDSISFNNLVLLTTDQEEMQHAFIREFEYANVYGRVTNKYAREYGTQIILLKGASNNFRQFFREKLKADRLKTRLH